ncbi:hypothetical protein EV356DRAFT_510194 [Viridothelium virens]|uniref:Uncharacterized protein n=1 Tax=Viridothelium virens TaxID=1048519 RepID=A0A6A6GVA8_VIRVR|nr:hypothetical protein EV356DRAFT_510194 [Viridothelium virens]
MSQHVSLDVGRKLYDHSMVFRYWIASCREKLAARSPLFVDPAFQKANLVDWLDTVPISYSGLQPSIGKDEGS